MALAVPVVGDGEPACLLGERFLAFQRLELVLLGDLGGDHLEDMLGDPAQRDRVMLGPTDQMVFCLPAVLDREGVDTLHDHRRLVFGERAGGHRVPDRFVVVVQGVRERRRRFASRLVCRVALAQ